MLKAVDLSVKYGDAVAVDRVALDVAEREVVAVIGANGAGKSSLGKAVAGLTPSGGVVELFGEPLRGRGRDGWVDKGIVYMPEGRRVFAQLSVDDNLRAGAFTKRRSEPWAERLEEVYTRVPRLRERMAVKAALLSGGEQQLLAICRGLMAFPRLLVLDEPSLGLAPVAINAVVELLDELVNETELSVIILEQNISFTSRVAGRAYVMHLGRITNELDGEQVRDAEAARAAVAVAGQETSVHG